MGRPRGRPTKYKPEYDKQAANLALLGYTNEELAQFFEVDRNTLDKWMRDNPTFFSAINANRDEADAKIVRSLRQRARGYRHKSEKIFCQNGVVTRVECIEQYPPDTAAMIFWLKNRQRNRWRDRQDVDINPSDAFVNMWKAIGSGAASKTSA